MDLNRIKSVITDQFHDLSDLSALKVENHIYGCYMIIQDIVEKDASLSQFILTKKNKNDYYFDVNQQFSQIGIRYGFVMDSLLVFDSYLPTYKELWLEIFNDISLTMDTDLVDTIEETINECLIQLRPIDKSFFFSAAQNGYLSQDDMDRVIDLLHPSLSYKHLSIITEKKPSLLTSAATETQLHTSKFKKFNVTRRRIRMNVQSKNEEKTYKKHLSKTRRVHFK